MSRLPTGKYAPYSAYKASGIPWLGEIPAHWNTVRSDSLLCQQRQMIDPKALDSDIVFHYSIPVIEATGNGQVETVSEIDSAKLLLKRPALLISRLNPRKSRVLIAELHDEPTICSSEFVVLEPFNCLMHYAWYLFGSDELRQYFSARVDSATRSHQRVSPEHVSKVWLGVPPLNEQKAISAFLDRETVKIDRLIAKKERLIALLQEKRLALISHAVTKGLNADAPMKNSGVDWLGEIPAHWSVAPVYVRYRVQLGKMLDSGRITGNHLAPYLRNVDVQWDYVNVENLPQMDFDAPDQKRFTLYEGDLLVCEGGEVGRAAIWCGELEECYYQKAIHRLRPFSDSDLPRFMFYVLFTAAKRGVFVAGGNPNTIDHLTSEKLRGHRIGFPPLPEQRAIASYLDRETARIDVIIGKTQAHIGFLRERRTALISAAVTGKIDVREESLQ